MILVAVLFAETTAVGLALTPVFWRRGREDKARLVQAGGAAAILLARQRALESLGDGGFIAWLSDGLVWSGGLSSLFGLTGEEVTRSKGLSPFLAADEFAAITGNGD
ncbi:MAG: hypothetical protein VCE75_09655 [Alphaproteobacteria bacterium]|jgi:hypothetical protein